MTRSDAVDASLSCPSGPDQIRALPARWRLDGRRAVVTGGTLGIGHATAQELLTLGAEVLIVARNSDRVQACLHEWHSCGLPAHGIAADMSTPAGRDALHRAVGERWGGLDLLVNNVGTNVRKAVTAYSPEEYDFILATNLTSMFELCRGSHPLLRQGVTPAIVNVTSVAGLTHLKTGTPYGMTKAAIIQLTRNLAVEWAVDGIRVNAVAPWYTRTPLAQPVLDQPATLAKILERTPLGRYAEPLEVAAAIAWLCMPAASYVTGQCLAVDGGFSINGY